MVRTVCSLRFSMTVVAWMRVQAVYVIWYGFSANRFWIHSLAGFWIPKAGFWIPMPSIPDSKAQKFSGFRNPDYLKWRETLLRTKACNRAWFQLAEVFWSYISLCTVYRRNDPLSLGHQLINTLIATSLVKFVLPGRNEHGINFPGSWEQANCSWLNKNGGRRRWCPVCSPVYY